MNKKQALTKEKMETGRRALTGNSFTIIADSAPFESESKSVEGANNGHDGQSITKEIFVPPIENEDLSKSRIRYPSKISKLTQRIRRLKVFWKPEPTPAEKELLEQQAEQTRIFRSMYPEMRHANAIIPNAYYNMRIEYTPTNKGGLEKQKARKVQFSMWNYTVDGNTIYGKVRKIPWGIMPGRLVEPEVLNGLANSVGHPVGGKCGDEGEGIIIYVQLAGRNDFPDRILFRDMLPKVPKGELPLTFICGATKNGGREYRPLEQMPHFMGAGETGGGKTNFMHAMICTFISRNSPKEVRLAMIDLKFGGVALNRYSGIPHLIKVQKNELEEEIELEEEEGLPKNERKPRLPDVPTGIANDIPSSVSLLKWAFLESVRRGELFLTDKKYHPQKIEDWNKHHRNQHLPRLVIFIDELALLMDKSDIDEKSELVLIKLARFYIKSILRLARSSGVHLCGFTQCLDKSVMGVAFKTNVPGRLCFSVGDSSSSILVVGDGSAVNLQPRDKGAGRAIFKHGNDKFTVQTPLITEADIDECVKNAKAGKLAVEFHSQAVTSEDLVRFAIEKGNMFLGQEKLKAEFKDSISFHELLELLTNMDGKMYEVDGVTYRVIPGRGRLPRRIERV